MEEKLHAFINSVRDIGEKLAFLSNSFNVKAKKPQYPVENNFEDSRWLQLQASQPEDISYILLRIIGISLTNYTTSIPR